MKCSKVQVYLAGRLQGEVCKVRAAMSYDLDFEVRELARMGYSWFWPLTGLQSLYTAYILLQQLHSLPWSMWSIEWEGDKRIKQVQRWLKKQIWLKRLGVKILPHDRPEAIVSDGQIIESGYEVIAAILRGRNLFFSEILNGLHEMGLEQYTKEVVEKNLLQAMIHHRIEMVPATLPEEGVCLRCGASNLELIHCGICGEVSYYCPECAAMGESLSCRPVFRRADRSNLSEEALSFGVRPYYTFPLSTYQKQVSDRLESALQRSQGKSWLLWAVCGAGKTETTFALIAKVLERGGRVLFASPRREVVRQMVERFVEAFPETTCIGLYGGSKVKLTQAQITVSTVHQLARFYQAFDLIIFDEVDAFPYQGDPRLVKLLERSLKTDGRLVLLSATPGEDLLREAKAGKLQVLTLPARFHRKGVPVPMLFAARLPSTPDYSMLPSKIQRWITESLERELAQLYIFLPTRNMVEAFGESLKRYYEQQGLADWVHYTHSQDGERSSKVQDFLYGKYPILVTTTILERGVTVPKSNVLVLYADYEEIFNHQSLIQMAGRGGRSLYAPTARVWFVGKRISKEMRIAANWIDKMNLLAKERGLLDEEARSKRLD